MRTFWTAAIVGLGLAGTVDTASAQYGYGGQGYGYQERELRRRDYDEDYGGRRRGGYAFDEGEYLRCNGDVRRAVRTGEFDSGFQHYQRHGRREGRRLSC